MIIIVDFGNSRIKWNAFAHHCGAYLYKTQVLEWNEQSLTPLFQSQWFNIASDISDIIVSNVAGQVMGDVLTKWTDMNIKKQPHFIVPTASYKNVKNGYEQPNTLGADRWMAVIAAHYQHPHHHVIVVDCGTATTIDAVSPNGQHMAGPIIAGEKILTNALLQYTADIQFEQPEDEQMPLIVTDTYSAARHGAKLASLHGTKQAVLKMSQLLDNSADIKVVLTGGRAKQVMPELKEYDCVHHPDLVLGGISVVAKDTVGY